MSSSCEDRIDAELQSELEEIQKALGSGVVQFWLRCDGCGREWESEDEFEDCTCDCSGYAEVFDEDEEEKGEYNLLSGLYVEHIVVRADISAGGPGDFWRLYLDPEDKDIVGVSYHHLAWEDEAMRRLSGRQFEMVREWFWDQVQELWGN